MAVFGLLCSLQSVLAQNLSNRGKDFWVGFGHHQFMETGNPDYDMVLYFSAEQAANVTVTINGTPWIRNYAVSANSVIVSDIIPRAGAVDARLYSLPCSFVPPGTPCGGEGIFTTHGIHIISDVPIVAYAHIYGAASSGATMLMPTETWGYSYVTLNSKQSYATNCFSWVYVIAQQDNTVVEITPAATTRSGRPANVPFTVNLNRGEIYQCMAGPETGTVKPEMSGTKIKSIANATGSCTPIAVFAGSSRTNSAAICGTGGGDNDNQQCFPSQAWGKRYLTAPTSNSVTPSTQMINIFKIAVKDPATIVKRNGVQIPFGNLVNNSYYTYESGTPDYIEADKPVMVAQYMSGGTTCMGGGGVGDPEMMYISPIEQGIKRIGFYRNTQENITVNYLTLIIPTAGVSSLTIDGSAAFNHTYVHPNLPGYTVVVKRWTAAQAQAIAQSDSAFTAITYGLGNVESYGYNAGTLINNLSAVGCIFNVSDTSTTTSSHPFTCTNTPFKMSIYLAYPTPPTKLVWKLSELAPMLTPNADITDNSPTPDGPPFIINGTPYYKYSIPGTYSFNTTGTYTVGVEATHPSIENCNNTERVSYELPVNAKPIAGFTFTHTGCILDPVQFAGPSSTGNGYTLNQWLWTFPGTTTDNTQNPSHTFSATGNQNVNLHVVSTEGCVSDSVRVIPVFPKPTASISTVPLNASACEGESITFTGNTSFGGSGAITNYYWNFGNTVTSTTAGPHSATYPAPGIYNAYLIAGVSNACKSDTAFKTVRVYAKPTTTFSYPAGCLPAGGLVQFTSNATTPDGQAITGHLWNFGDPGSGAANTSTLANPTHTYSSFGNYVITYSVTTANGCTKDTTVNATFNLPPTFSYPVLPAVCYYVPSVSVATASVTNGVVGSGVYHGPGTTTAGVFTPAAAGAGTHTIWYVYSTAAGCNDSISRTITVHPRVGANFVIPTASCLPVSGNVQFNYSGTVSAGQQYLWNFGDPASGVNNTSVVSNPTHNYTTGNYTINLTVTSTTGCSDDTTMTTNFTVKPALAYPALPAVCESVAGTVSVATASVTNAVPGTGVYHGPFTDLAGNFNPSAAGAGTHTIWYVFTATGNCIDSISRTILVHAKPTASFNFTSAACLPTTGLVQFTYNGTLSAGQQYLWNFGDPASGAANTSTAMNPTHNYTNTGSHTLTLTVTNTNTCVDDSVVTAIFSVKPALTYAALSALCESVIGSVSVASATVTNNVTGSGTYHGPGTDAAGNFSPSVAGPGNHTIWYVFTSTGNCTDSVSQTITVNAKPPATFTATADICLNQQASIANISASAPGNINTWKWYFGDATTATNSNNNAFTKSYTTFGNYTIKLVTVNNNGCNSDTSYRTVAVHSMPKPDFSMPASVCMPGTANFTNNSQSPDGSALAYVWDFGDASGTSTATSPGYAYSTSNTYNITLLATSAFGCAEDTIKSFSAFFDKPIADFDVSPSVLCQGTANTFDNNSIAPNSTIASYLWTFGDNTTSTESDPSKLYALPGVYTVQLQVTSTENCVSDPFPRTVTVYLQPVVDAGPSFVVPQGSTLKFRPTVNDSLQLTFQWSPPTGLSDPNVLRPVLTANRDQEYRLTATGQGNCNASDVLTVKVYKPVKIPNAFSPNGDNTNDTWVITNIIDYAGATVEVFNRYGQQVYKSTGYSKAWDGTYKGKPLPVATYYYVIDLKNDFEPLTGSVTIIR